MSSQECTIFKHANAVARHNRLCAWFLGPNAENSDLLHANLQGITQRDFITPAIRASPEYQNETLVLAEMLEGLSKWLELGTVPFWSPRYNAHMASDTSMPALLAYVSTALFNPNNISPEAAPLTSKLEVEFGEDICEMLGFPPSNGPSKPWGHITSGGSVANMEAVWAARNLKFYPLSLFNAIAPGQPLEFIRNSFKVTLCNNSDGRKLLKHCSTWELLNLKPDTILEIPHRLEGEYDIAAGALTSIMKPFLVQTLGIHVLEKQFGIINKPTQFIAGATKHYSFPKGCALVGIGSSSLADIPVDVFARMDIQALDRYLNNCLEKQQAVYAVVAIMGSTDHGAVDPLAEICKLRRTYQARGMSFVIHADAAWGGYFATLLRQNLPSGFRSGPSVFRSGQLVPERSLSDYVKCQLEALAEADSVTVDPHKSGYIPFPAGGLCYRDGRMRYQLTWFNPSGHGSANPDMNLSVFGMEGSKPGAAAAAAWLSHLMLGLDRDGYGLLLGQAKFGGLKMYCHLATMDMGRDSLRVVPLVMLPAEKANASDQEVVAQKLEIIKRIRDRPNHEITADDLKFASNLGSDLSINSFACNFRVDGHLNADIAEANYLNQRIYERLSITRPDDDVNTRPLIIMLTEVNQKAYGVCAERFKQRLGLVGGEDLKILVNCVMSPFPTTSNFTGMVAAEFRGVAEDVIGQYSLHRNTTSPTRFYFIMQGMDKVYLVLPPMFHMANYRHQLILTCDLSNNDLAEYRAARKKEPGRLFSLCNMSPMTLESMLNEGSFIAGLRQGLPGTSDDSAQDFVLSKLRVTNVNIVKNHPLNSRFLDMIPPDNSIFYLYGSPEEMHIEHALLVGENVQLTSDQVVLDLEFGSPISSGDLSKGLVVVFRDMHERTFLPIVPPRTPSLFSSGQPHRVLIFRDPTSANANGPGLFDGLASAEPIAGGILKLGNMTFADSTLINTDPWRAQGDNYSGGSKQRTYQPGNKEATHEVYRKLHRLSVWGEVTTALRYDYHTHFGAEV